MNWHALAGDEGGNAFQIVFHIPIPSANNRAVPAVNYRTALVNSGIGGTTVMAEGNGAGQITSAEKAQIASGELFEHVETFHSHPGETAGQLQGKIDARYNALISLVQGRLQRQLTYFGHQRNVT